MRKLAFLAMCLSLSACGFEIVDTGYRGIQTRFGEVVGEPLPEGLHFYNPFTSDIIEYGVRQETWSTKSAIFTQDNQRVDVSFSVTYNPDPKVVTSLYRDFGRENDLVIKVIQPVVLGSIQNAIGKVVADELNQKKDFVRNQALKDLKSNLEARHVSVTDLQLTDVDFEDSYEKAAEEKVVAVQNAQKAKNETVTIEERAKQVIKTAEADARAMQIKSQALQQNKGLIEYEAIQKWDGKLPQYQFGNSTPFINLDGVKRSPQ
jgi:prohibitin 2